MMDAYARAAAGGLLRALLMSKLSTWDRHSWVHLSTHECHSWEKCAKHR